MKTFPSKLILSASILSLLISACGIVPVVGSGDIVTETLPLSGFDRVSVSGGAKLVIIQDGTESVTVETDENIIQYVVMEVRGSTLELYTNNRGMQTVMPTRLIYTVHVKDLGAVSVSGSCEFSSVRINSDNLRIDVSGSANIKIAELTAGTLTVRISGSGQMEAAGEVSSQDIETSGSAQLKLGDLRSETASITISGSGEATLWVTSSLTASISGSGTVRYYGSPQTTINTSGSGSLQNLGEK